MLAPALRGAGQTQTQTQNRELAARSSSWASSAAGTTASKGKKAGRHVEGGGRREGEERGSGDTWSEGPGLWRRRWAARRGCNTGRACTQSRGVPPVGGCRCAEPTHERTHARTRIQEPHPQIRPPIVSVSPLGTALRRPPARAPRPPHLKGCTVAQGPRGCVRPVLGEARGPGAPPLTRMRLSARRCACRRAASPRGAQGNRLPYGACAAPRRRQRASRSQSIWDPPDTSFRLLFSEHDPAAKCGSISREGDQESGPGIGATATALF